ncbi:hypothetical protein BV20DRAFT_481697 [Pilatotrama ljubarskyi]|nr:hypothetical protein BV20DRAFT_481697 [Pilatotrama ljubarskyi]
MRPRCFCSYFVVLSMLAKRHSLDAEYYNAVRPVPAPGRHRPVLLLRLTRLPAGIGVFCTGWLSLHRAIAIAVSGTPPPASPPCHTHCKYFVPASGTSRSAKSNSGTSNHLVIAAVPATAYSARTTALSSSYSQ